MAAIFAQPTRARETPIARWAAGTRRFSASIRAKGPTEGNKDNEEIFHDSIGNECSFSSLSSVKIFSDDFEVHLRGL
ncbi:MAG TPA: hypothetical protein VH229_04555 [Candidatus Udaeobacter sp.]|nr:hypothetical protein [Candidatus Udaeobacter sp.]